MSSIQFKPNVRKILEVILWLANCKPGMGFHQILKLIFFADEYHLNTYGRPVTGDSYVAMEYGPVASLAYDLLKKEELIIELLDEVPFSIEKKKVFAERRPDLNFLSESDIEALEYSLNTYRDENFNSLTDITHTHKAWLSAREKGGKNPGIDFEDMIESDGNREQIKAVCRNLKI